jgi:hypothetical protein
MSEFNENIYLSETDDGCYDEKGNYIVRKEGEKQGIVVWLNFRANDGSHAMISLNNLANDKDGIINRNMRKAIVDYIAAIDRGELK